PSDPVIQPLPGDSQRLDAETDSMAKSIDALNAEEDTLQQRISSLQSIPSQRQELVASGAQKKDLDDKIQDQTITVARLQAAEKKTEKQVAKDQEALDHRKATAWFC